MYESGKHCFVLVAPATSTAPQQIVCSKRQNQIMNRCQQRFTKDKRVKNQRLKVKGVVATQRLLFLLKIPQFYSCLTRIDNGSSYFSLLDRQYVCRLLNITLSQPVNFTRVNTRASSPLQNFCVSDTSMPQQPTNILMTNEPIILKK